MAQQNRRDFISHVGRGMVIAGIGSSLAAELGFGDEFAHADQRSLDFGNLRPLVDQIRETPAAQLQESVVSQLNAKTLDLRELTAAAALANAETFGGEDYVGFHTEMALVPALEMSRELSGPATALPVLKVLYRNAQRIQQVGGRKKQTLRQLPPSESGAPTSMALRDAARQQDVESTEMLFASIQDIPIHDRFNALVPMIADDINVHRFVLAHRAMELIPIVGAEQAHTMLRQCVRYCVQEETERRSQGRAVPDIRDLIPRLFDTHQLDQLQPGSVDPGETWIEEMSQTIYGSSPAIACDAVAAALAEGIAPSVIAEAISLTANALVLRQGNERWRTHGDSAGVHASDAANAWRQMVEISQDRNLFVGLIVSAYHTAAYNPFPTDPYPLREHTQKLNTDDAGELLGICEECIRANDQGVAAAAIQHFGQVGGSPEKVFELMLRYAISEDGRLHGEKYYRTVTEEFQAARPRFRWRQLVGLARVTASAYGYDREDNPGCRAPGYEDARNLLRLG